MSFSEAENRIAPLFAAPDNPASSGSSRREEPSLAEMISKLLDRIRALDKTMDQARAEKISSIKKALAEGTYHVSAAEVARKIIDQLDEP